MIALGVFMKSMKSPKSTKIIDFQQFSTFWWHPWSLVTSTTPNRPDNVEKIKNSVQTFSNASETCVFEGKTFPHNSRRMYPSWSHYEISWNLKILQNPLKSLISIDIQRYPLVHQSGPESKKCCFVSNYAPRRWQNTVKIAPELFLECQTICRKILENSSCFHVFLSCFLHGTVL